MRRNPTRNRPNKWTRRRGRDGGQGRSAALTARDAAFLTSPHDLGGEFRCFLRDPDGHLVEISESVTT
jgi:catechol 2,3-dioxygenase-like lactoylglutathione lyase family enzyme